MNYKHKECLRINNFDDEKFNKAGTSGLLLAVCLISGLENIIERDMRPIQHNTCS